MPPPVPMARPLLGAEEERAVVDVVRSGHLAAGPVVRAFEQAFCDAVEAPHAVALANGTLALEAVLHALGIGPGDEVVVPSFTFVATANAVLYTGATPVFADVRPDTFVVDATTVAAAIGPRTRAMVPVHLYGLPADMDALTDTADRHGVALIGDAAQAHGARWAGRSVAALGDAATWSFYPTKNMTSGEGGMVTTRDEELARLVRSIANHGREADEHGSYDHRRLGNNWRLSDLHAAIGRVQAGRLKAFNDRRRAVARLYDEAFAGLTSIQPPVVPEAALHAYHQYTLLCQDRATVQRVLADHGVASAVYYPRALPEHDHLKRLRGEAANARRLAATVLSVPVHAGLGDEEVDRVVAAVLDADRACR